MPNPLAELDQSTRTSSKRELYRHVDFKTIEWPLRDVFRKHVTPERIVERARNVFSDIGDLQPSDVIVDFSTRSYGMREKNPVDRVLFYSKRHPTKCHKADRGVITSVLPQWFAEDVLNIYTKKANHLALVQAGYRAILKELQNDEKLTVVVDDSSFESSQEADPVSTRQVLGSTGPNCPSTPPKARTFRRAVSLKDLGRDRECTPFSNNEFTTLPIDYSLPASPSQRQASKAVKRKLDQNFESENNPSVKQKK